MRCRILLDGKLLQSHYHFMIHVHGKSGSWNKYRNIDLDFWSWWHTKLYGKFKRLHDLCIEAFKGLQISRYSSSNVRKGAPNPHEIKWPNFQLEGTVNWTVWTNEYWNMIISYGIKVTFAKTKNVKSIKVMHCHIYIEKYNRKLLLCRKFRQLSWLESTHM